MGLETVLGPMCRGTGGDGFSARGGRWPESEWGTPRGTRGARNNRNTSMVEGFVMAPNESPPERGRSPRDESDEALDGDGRMRTSVDGKMNALKGLSRADLHRLFRLVRPHGWTLAAAFCALFIGTGMTLLYPLLIGKLIDEGLTHAAPARLNAMIAVMIVVFAIQSIFVFGRSYLFTVVGERVVADLREALYASIMRQEIAFFDQRRTGELVSRLGSDTVVLQNTVTANLSMALRFSVQALGAVGVLVYTSIRLTGVMLAVVPVVVAAAVLYGRRVRRLSTRVQDSIAQSAEIAEETLGSIRTVRSFAAESDEVERYSTAVERSYELARRRTQVTSLFGAVVVFAGYSSIALVLWYGGRLVIEGELTIGALTAFVLYTLMVAVSLGTLSGLHADFMRAIGASERVFELMEREPKMSSPRHPERLSSWEGRVTLEGVRFAYPSRPELLVLKGVGFELAPGETVAVVGPSGGGKSTIAALIPRFYDPLDGVVRVDGHDVRRLDLNELRSHIAMVAQEPVLFATSIARNIAYGRPGASPAAIRAAAESAGAHEFIEGFPKGYDTPVGERGVRLSGGQKQRIAIARAILKDPRILILDEATSALDAETEFVVQQALERLMRGRTTLVIAHRLSTVKSADRVLVLEGGVIVQEGSHASLAKADGLYRQLLRRQLIPAS